LIDAETWAAVRNRLAANAGEHRRKAEAAEPSLLAGLLFDARGERLIPSHAVKKSRRYRYYVSAALITKAGTVGAQGWRLGAMEVENAVIEILRDALANPAKLLDHLGTTDTPGEQLDRMLARAGRLAAALNRSPGERANTVRGLVERLIISDETITLRVRRGALSAGNVRSATSGDHSDNAIELRTAVAWRRRGVGTKLVLPGLAQPNHSSRNDPVLVKAIARGRAWFEELATGRARSLQELAKRDGISRRYIRRLVNLAFLSPQLVEAILQSRQPAALNATRLTELDLPLDWTEQSRLLAS
jgi:site-specific DNA recombinase